MQVALQYLLNVTKEKAFCFQVPSLPWLIVARNKNQIFDDSIQLRNQEKLNIIFATNSNTN